MIHIKGVYCFIPLNQGTPRDNNHPPTIISFDTYSLLTHFARFQSTVNKPSDSLVIIVGFDRKSILNDSLDCWHGVKLLVQTNVLIYLFYMPVLSPPPPPPLNIITLVYDNSVILT